MGHWHAPFSQWKAIHKYRINSNYLGDQSLLAWRNLGYWDGQTQDYAQACQQLADRLAQAVQLKANDTLIDLGCGQGASLVYWQQHYAIKNLYAVELQQDCVDLIQQNLMPSPTLYTQSFLNLAPLSMGRIFDAVLCIDAAYHSPVDDFLNSVTTVMKTQARLGFHTLVLTRPWQQLSRVQQQRYRYLLKAADIHIQHLMTAEQLNKVLLQHQFGQIRIEDLSAAVLNGFAHYAKGLTAPKLLQSLSFDYLKIKMTAKLCEHLYQDGLIAYVQISAIYQASQ